MFSSFRNTFLVSLLTALIGFGAAWVMMPSSRDEEILQEVRREAHQTGLLTSRLVAVEGQLRALQARAAVRQPSPAPEAGGLGPLTSPGAALVASVEEVLSSPTLSGSEEALSRGRRLLEDAIASHRWGTLEVSELRKLMVDMNGPQRLEVMQMLAAALNRGDIQGTISSLLID